MPVALSHLDNGIDLILEPIVTAKTAAIGFWFSVGSRYEEKNQRGITHFVEHMLFKGTSSRTARDIALAFDRIGGYINAFTDRENLCVHCVVPSEYAEKAIEIMNDMMNHSLFSPEEIEKERQVIESEIISSYDDPEEAANEAVFQAIWPNQSLSQSIAGSVEDIASLVREDLLDWYTRYIQNGKLLICISGNFSERKIRAALETNPDRKKIFNEPPFSLPNPHEGFHFLSASFQMEQLFFCYNLEKPKTLQEYLHWHILNAIIGDTMSSRLFQSLRERAAYCYTVYSYYATSSDSALLCAYASASKKNVKKLIADMKKEMQGLFTLNISEEEVEASKQHLCGEEIIASEDPEQRMKQLALQYFLDLPLVNSEERIEEIKKTKVEHIEALIKNNLHVSKSAFALYGPSLDFYTKRMLKKKYKDEYAKK